MIVYNKLVRDRIPEIIAADGKSCVVRVLERDECLRELRRKLEEELREYLQSAEILELVDLAEIIYALAQEEGIDAAAFDQLRRTKRSTRGGFERRLFLERVEDA
jgi:predicted house-cleaning noncanonical NTP pyrophosphatase (MazG superfamily)